MKKILLEETLKEEFRLKRISLTKVARDCHIPPSVLHGWLHGTLPSAKNINHIKTLADYLGYSVDHLLFGKQVTKNKKTIISKTTFTENGIDYHLTIERC
jgi:transcriptional regulator with XRE-family HTH domain